MPPTSDFGRRQPREPVRPDTMHAILHSCWRRVPATAGDADGLYVSSSKVQCRTVLGVLLDSKLIDPHARLGRRSDPALED